MAIQRISSAEIADGTVIAADIADGAVGGNNIVANAIRANNIVAATITGNLIATSQITGNLLTANCVTSNNIVSVSGSVITANTIANSTIQTGAIENYMRANTLDFGMRNRIINGAMRIDQRNAGAAITGNDAVYSVDRFKFETSQSSKFTAQQDSSANTVAGFTSSLKIVSSSSYSITSSDYFGIFQNIEGNNVADLRWGTANARPVTLSFFVRSSLTGTFGGSLRNNGADRSYPFSYTISAADTWEQKFITIAGDTSGTWLTTNGIGIRVGFGLGVGSTYSGTAGSWAGANYSSATGATSVVGTNGATFYITGVQLEVGSTATSFDYRPYGTELALCQRYYETIGVGIVGGSYSTTQWIGSWMFKVTKRIASPTIANNSVITLWDASVATYTQSSTNLVATAQGFHGATLLMGNFSGMNAFRPMSLNAAADTAISASAEL